jgi:hypothetical protein
MRLNQLITTVSSILISLCIGNLVIAQQSGDVLWVLEADSYSPGPASKRCG